MFVWVATAFACATNFWMSCAALVNASASAAPFSTSSASLVSCAVLWSSCSLWRRATALKFALRRAASSEPLARMLAICRMRPTSSAADRTSCACSAALRDRSCVVEVSSSVPALISSVAAEISAAIAAASSAAWRIAPTSRRNATTIVCTADSSSLTSEASARCVTIVTERSPLATRLATAPAARTGSVMRRLSQRDSHSSTPTATPSTASKPIPMLRSVTPAAA